MSSRDICPHCGEYLQLAGERTHYFEAWDTWEAEASISPDGELIVDGRWGPSGGDGDTVKVETEWTRTCCYEPLTPEEYKEWNLNDSAIFLD